jgi:hypothetical protein
MQHEVNGVGDRSSRQLFAGENDAVTVISLLELFVGSVTTSISDAEFDISAGVLMQGLLDDVGVAA